MKSILKDRNLWFDGISEISPSNLESFLIKGFPIGSLAVTDITQEVKDYNKFSDIKLSTKSNLTLSKEWVIPDKYKYLNIEKCILDLFDLIEKDSLYEKRVSRFEEEIELFVINDLYDILKVIIYILDTFKEKDIIWGVGRGSSCSSYIFYLMELHSVDCVLYDINIKDFIK